MSISIIYARSKNRCIGRKGRIPWHLPKDFSHFKKTTMGKPIIMGRKTYEDHTSALPGRRNIVITRNKNYQAVEGIEIATDLDNAIRSAYRTSDEIFIIGGAFFFERTLSMATTIYETVVDTEIEGDVFFPNFDLNDWSTELLSTNEIDDKNKFSLKIFKHTRLNNAG